MDIRFALAAIGLLASVAATPVLAQNNATIEGTESAPGNASGGPSAATTTGNLTTTSTTPGFSTMQSADAGPLPPGTVNTSSNSVAQTPGSPANTGK